MTAAAAAALAPGDAITFDDYLSVYDGVRAEWVEGAVVPMSPNSDRHQDLNDFLVALMRHCAEESDAGIVRSQQIPMQIGERARIPDVVFVTAGHRERLKPTHLDGPADLAVEITSRESRVRDRGEKFYEYEQAGVREYWLVDPLRESVELFRLDERGRYRLVAPGDGSRLSSEVLPGFWIDPAWLWRNPMPKLNWVLKEWGLI